MQYALLFYTEPGAFEGLTEAEQRKLDGESFAYDESLKASGHFIAASALQAPNAGVTIQVRGGKLSTTDGPFAETKEHLGGFILVEARDLNEAIRLAAGMPVARIGRIDVRPEYELKE